MALPKQVRQQIKQNEEISEAIRKEQQDTRAEHEKAAQAEIDALLNEVDPKDKPKEKPKAEVTELRPQHEGGDPESTPEEKPERTDWKQKYAVLKGKYDAEVPRLHQDLKDANARLTSLEDKLASMVTSEPKEEKETPRTDFTPEEIEDYGEDLLDVMGRKARQIVEQEYRPKIAELESTVSSLKAKLGETGERVGKFEQNEVFAQLDREVEDWRKINVDPEFHEWLDQQDPYSGATRKDLLLNAFNRKNARQVKAFFEGYKKENAAVIPNTADSTPSGQGGTDTESRLNLNEYVAPGTPKGGGNAGAPRDKRIWSTPEIGRFYSDVQKGRYKNRPEDKARIEADIVAATREGRIQS